MAAATPFNGDIEISTIEVDSGNIRMLRTKIYRAEILKELQIEQDHFAANAETGLKPILAGYDIQEAPVSWINCTLEMGKSSCRDFQALLSIVWKSFRSRGRSAAASAVKAGVQ